MPERYDPPLTTPSGLRQRLPLHRLDIELDLQRRTDRRDPRLHDLVVVHGEVLPPELGGGPEGGTGPAPGIGPRPQIREVQVDGAYDTTHGQLTPYGPPVRTGHDEPRGPVRDLRVPLDVQEVRRPQVFVPHRVARVDGGRPDDGLHPGLGHVVRGDLDRRREVGEAAVHAGDAQVLGDRAHAG